MYRLHNAAGFWGPVTSSVDWCEHNYEVSYYVAEFFNCFSNLAIVAAGLLGLRNALRHGYPRRVLVLYTAITVIGLDRRRSTARSHTRASRVTRR